MLRHRRAAVLRRLAELVVARPRLRRAPRVLLWLLLLRLLLWWCAPLVLRRLVLLLLRRRVLVLRGWELLVRRGELLVGLRVVGHGGLLLRRAPRVLLGLLLLLLRRAPRVAGRLLLRHRRLALTAAVLVRLPVRGLPVLRLPVLIGRLLLGHGRRAPRVLLLRLLLLRLAPGVGRLPGRAGRRGLMLRRLLLVRVGGLLVLAALLRPRRGAVLRLAALLRARRRVAPLLVVVPARALPLGAARAGEVGPAAHAEQIALLERFVTDRTFQGRHDTSPERTPARSSLDVR
ncbi:hypothetical protein [Actinomadura soli]|uniref:hypothetical protein n=1 Tax=Actinomadura soli TaxID=2508997 RepID=UPI001486B51A|nr:hypothetical protein [Actinomadura soli]